MKRTIAPKALALILCAVLSLAPLAGCQGRDTPSEPSSPSQSSSLGEESSSSEDLEEPSSSQLLESSSQGEAPTSSSIVSSTPPVSSSSAPAAPSSSAVPFAIPSGSITKVVVSNGGHETYDDVITVTGQEDINELVQLFNSFADSVQKADRSNPPTGGMVSKVDFYYGDGSVASYGYLCGASRSDFYFSTAGQAADYYSESPSGILVNQIPERMLKKYPTSSSYFNYNGPAKGWILDDQNMLYFPLTQNETNQILAAMRNFGLVAVSEVDPGTEGWSSNIRIQRQNATEDLYEYECHTTGIAVDGGKFFLVDSGRLSALYSLRDSMMNRTTGNPQWLVTMNAARATNMQVTAGGKVYSTDAKDIIADVTAQLKQLTCHTGTVKTPSAGDYSGLSEEARRIQLDFETGTQYTITLHENGEITISATGLDFMCVYQTVSGQTLSALCSRVDSLAAQGVAA